MSVGSALVGGAGDDFGIPLIGDIVTVGGQHS